MDNGKQVAINAVVLKLAMLIETVFTNLPPSKQL
jgi:hypothetical protein